MRTETTTRVRVFLDGPEQFKWDYPINQTGNYCVHGRGLEVMLVNQVSITVDLDEEEDADKIHGGLAHVRDHYGTEVPAAFADLPEEVQEEVRRTIDRFLDAAHRVWWDQARAAHTNQHDH